MTKEYIKFLSFDFNPNNRTNPIKATNYIKSNFQYKTDDLWRAFLNYDATRCTGCISEEFEPIQTYIIDSYNSGEPINKIIHKLTSSYYDSMDSYHKDLILKSIEFGHAYNNLRYLDTYDGMHTKMEKFFAQLIHEPTRGLGALENPKCYKIVKENRDYFTNLKNSQI